ncbi:MAG: tRNA(Ile)-lysidine synthase [Candidatus Hepatoplasma vulgare]|nr:MAG: tRNA(Ile)-lysidine synthase [Candidatus Hepatoplasma sp.]
MFNNKKTIVVGVSGGSDSMALLDILQKKDKYKIIANHINYHFRTDSNYDEEVVKDYCNKNDIKLEILSVNDELYQNYNYLKNKQSIAREIRYDFYLRNADKYQASSLYLAHHKDDFIETAIMQESRSNSLFFYGISEKSYYKGLKIKRPLINKYKEELIAYCSNNNITFAIDSTNSQPIYERNRIRIELSKRTKIQKEKIYDYYKKINDSNEIKRKKIENLFQTWEKKIYNYTFLLKQKEELRKHLLYRFLINNDYFIKISTNKLEGLDDFLIKGSKDKSYRLTENLYLTIENDVLVIKEK